MQTIPIYFPMTYLSASVESMLAACFRQIAVYRPSNCELTKAMQAAVDLGRLLVSTPIEKNSAELLAQMNAFYAWAEINKGADLSLFKGNQASIPFFDETSISRIKQTIKERGDGGAKREPGAPLFEARLFLEMAQELDRQNSELERSLDDLRVKENKMLADLLEEDQDRRGIDSVQRPASAADPGAYMTANRIQAWWKMAREGSEPCNLLVTESEAVIEYLIEHGPGMEKKDLPGPLPLRRTAGPDLAVWQGKFQKYLEQWVSKPDMEAGVLAMPAVKPGETVVNITLYRSKRGDASAFFSGLNRSDGGVSDHRPGERLVICLVGAAGK